MSYDIYLRAESCQDNRPGNYTYNVDAMFALALGDPESRVRRVTDIFLHRGDPVLSRFLHMRAGDCIEALSEAVTDMRENPAQYIKLNPPNGWGNYEGALEYLQHFLDACNDSPNATVEMDL